MNEQELDSNTTQYVTVVIGGQLFGIPIEKVHDVFMPDSITRVPRSENEIAGVLNLRGRIVTAIDMRRLLNLEDREKDAMKMAVGIEYRGESYGFIIDNVGEVLSLSDDSREANPTNLNRNWTNISAGVHRLEGQLMVILDVEKLLGSMMDRIAA